MLIGKGAILSELLTISGFEGVDLEEIDDYDVKLALPGLVSEDV